MSCYIMQDDCLSPHLTVKEAMQVSANLKLGRGITQADKKIVINEILETLGLQDCVDTIPPACQEVRGNGSPSPWSL
nr:unnamed protein product [Callosobruchus chinensis]